LPAGLYDHHAHEIVCVVFQFQRLIGFDFHSSVVVPERHFVMLERKSVCASLKSAQKTNQSINQSNDPNSISIKECRTFDDAVEFHAKLNGL
jgi:hypothetical protein